MSDHRSTASRGLRPGHVRAFKKQLAVGDINQLEGYSSNFSE